MTSLDPVATTSRVTAAMRAQESRRPDRLFDDPLAAVLAGEQGMAMLAYATGDDIISVRTRWDDDRLLAADVDQVVLVAAGMDTRAWRLPLPGVVVYELDRPPLLALKASLVEQPPAATRVPVGVDLAGGWPEALRAAGHDPARPTCWVVEGLLQYLEADDVDRLLARITVASSPGSHLITDVVGAALLEQLAGTEMLTRFAEGGMPWVFGSDDPASLLTPSGWTVEVTALAVAAAGYGRAVATAGGPDGYLVHARR